MEAFWSAVIAPYWPVGAGVVGGYLYYRFIGCRSGACPLTANPWISTLYGALLGLMLT